MEEPLVVYYISIFEDGTVWIEGASQGGIEPKIVSKGAEHLKKSLEELIGPAELKETYFSTNGLDS
jgi:hypothetical protein